MMKDLFDNVSFPDEPAPKRVLYAPAEIHRAIIAVLEQSDPYVQIADLNYGEFADDVIAELDSPPDTVP